MKDLAELSELKETGNNEIRPDRLASTLLIIGFILASHFGSYSVMYLLVGEIPPSFILPVFLLGGSAIFYGWFRTVKGSSATKQLFDSTRNKVQNGSSAGIVVTFLVYLVTQSEGLNFSWLVPFLILSIVWALLFGIPSGGVGGLILASIWKNKYAAFIGGTITGAFFSSYWMLNFFGS